eukprot:Colp12_sorted_trinity150504_noHs@20662
MKVPCYLKLPLNTKDATQGQLTKVAAQLSKKEERIEQLEDNLAKKDELLAKKDTLLELWQQQFLKKNQDIDELHKLLAAKDEDLKALDKTHTDSINRLQKQLSDKNETLTNLQKKIMANDTSLSAFENQVKEKDQQIAELKANQERAEQSPSLWKEFLQSFGLFSQSSTSTLHLRDNTPGLPQSLKPSPKVSDPLLCSPSTASSPYSSTFSSEVITKLSTSSNHEASILRQRHVNN